MHKHLVLFCIQQQEGHNVDLTIVDLLVVRSSVFPPPPGPVSLSILYHDDRYYEEDLV